MPVKYDLILTLTKYDLNMTPGVCVITCVIACVQGYM